MWWGGGSKDHQFLIPAASTLKTIRVQAKHVPPPCSRVFRRAKCCWPWLTRWSRSPTSLWPPARRKIPTPLAAQPGYWTTHTRCVPSLCAPCCRGNFGVSGVFWSVLRWSLRSWQQLHRLIQTDKLSESLKQLFQYPPDNLINVIAPFFLSDYTYSSSCVSPVPFSLVIVLYASGRVPLLLPSVSCHRGSDEHSVPAVNGPSAAAAERLPVTRLGGGVAVCFGLFSYRVMGQNIQGRACGQNRAALWAISIQVNAK